MPAREVRNATRSLCEYRVTYSPRTLSAHRRERARCDSGISVYRGDRLLMSQSAPCSQSRDWDVGNEALSGFMVTVNYRYGEGMPSPDCAMRWTTLGSIAAEATISLSISHSVSLSMGTGSQQSMQWQRTRRTRAGYVAQHKACLWLQ